MIRNRTGSIALLCLVFTMILAACGGAPAATPTAAPAAAAPTAAAPAAADADHVPRPPSRPPRRPPSRPPRRPRRADRRPAAAPAAGATLNGVTLPADAAPADQQVYVVALRQHRRLHDDRFLRVGLQARRRGHRHALRPAGAPGQELQDPARRRHQVGGRLDRPGLDVPPRPEPDVVGRHAGDRRRLRGDLPLRRRSEARLGLHLVLRRRDQELGRCRRRQGAGRSARRQGGRRAHLAGRRPRRPRPTCRR